MVGIVLTLPHYEAAFNDIVEGAGIEANVVQRSLFLVVLSLQGSSENGSGLCLTQKELFRAYV